MACPFEAMKLFTRPQTAVALAASVCIAGLSAGCSSLTDTLSGDKVDYRNTGAQSVKLDVPPDLSQLPGQSRYGQTSSTVTASSLGGNIANPSGAGAPLSVAINQAGAYKMERQGQIRWLSVALPPEQLWPAVREFWTEQGFELLVDQPEAGLLETNYLENRAKVGEDGLLRNSIGRVLSFLYDSGERDQYRMRIERTATGSELYIAHRGLSEEYEDAVRKERTVWKGRPSDPQLEAAMLSRLLVKLGAPKAAADATVASAAPVAAPAAPASAYARLNDDKVSLTLDADLDTAWRRVGLALDRGGFTVENRDRKQGAYEIRLSDSDVEANRPNFIARLFGAKSGDGLSRFRVTVGAASGQQTQVQVLSDTGQPVPADAMAQRVAKQLLDELN
jgi:outer membrane protein assembly factor BamC